MAIKEDEKKEYFSTSKLQYFGTKAKIKDCDIIPSEILLAIDIPNLKQIH